MPSYQLSAPAALNVINADSSGSPCGAASGSYCREVPDVSASTDPLHGYVVYWDPLVVSGLQVNGWIWASSVPVWLRRLGPPSPP